MTIRRTIEDREWDKFFQDEIGDTTVRVGGNVSFSGLRNAGRITMVDIDNFTWTPLPATAITNRNAISIQNTGGEEIKIQYDPLTFGYSGVIMVNGSERFYDITANIIIYAKSISGPCTITVEELS